MGEPSDVGLFGQLQDLGLYSERDGTPLEDFKQKSDTI